MGKRIKRSRFKKPSTRPDIQKDIYNYVPKICEIDKDGKTWYQITPSEITKVKKDVSDGDNK